MPTPRFSLMADTINGILYGVGGHNGTRDVPTLEAYNPATNTWSTLASLPTIDSGNNGRYGGAAVALNGKLYVLGGWRTSPPLPTNSVLVYDPTANSWSTAASMPILSACSAAGVINGKIYVLTACDGFSGYRNFLHVYDPVANSWTSLAGSPHIHSEPAAGVINNGKFYVAGGFDGTIVTGWLDVYDPTTNTWSTKASMPTARQSTAGAIINGRLFVVGGYDGNNRLATTEMYDPLSDIWTSMAPMPTARSSLAGTAISGGFYAVGGSSAIGVLGTLEVFTPPATGCTYSISPTSQSFTASGGTGSVAVTTGTGCAWTAASNASWITITSGASGSGNGTVSYSGAANTGTTSRTGTMTIAGQTFTVTQAGLATLIVSPTTLTFTAQAGGSNPAAQNLSVVASDGSAISFTATASTTSGGGWLLFVASGPTPGNISVSVNISGLAAGTYNGHLSVTASGGTPVVVSVTLKVITLGVSPANLTFTAQQGAANPSAQSISVSASDGSAIAWTATASTTSSGNWLSISPASGTTPANISVSVNVGSLGAGTYSGQVSVSASGGTPVAVSVTLKVISLAVSPSILTFIAQLGGANPSAQTLSVSASDGSAVSWSASASTISGGNWLFVSPGSGTTPGNISVSVNIAGLAAGTYNGQVSVTASGGTPILIPVTLRVVGLTVAPTSLNFTAQSGGSNPSAQNLQVTASDGSALSWSAAATTTSGGNWLSIFPASGTTPSAILVTVNISGLLPGSYTGQVAVSPSSGSPILIPVTLSVSGVTLSFSPSTLMFTAQQGGANPAAQTLSVASSGGASIAWTATVTTTSGRNWLLISSTSGTTPGSISVSVNISGLATGTYQGTVAVQSAQATPATQSAAVTLTVQTAPPQLSVQPTSLSFQVQLGVGNPPPQTFQISNTGGGTLAWSLQTSTQSGGNWLAASPASGTAPAIVSVSVNVSNLAAGTYQGTVTVQAPQATPSTQTVAVTLTVQPAANVQLFVQPASLTFQVQQGAADPPPQTLVISNSGGSTLSWTAQATTQSGVAWLRLSPSSGTTPGLLSVSVSAANLTPGNYQGTVTVQAPLASPSTQTVAVTLGIQPALPAQLSVEPLNLTFEVPLGAPNPPPQTLRVANAGTGPLEWTAVATTVSGGNWLVVAPGAGTATTGRASIVTAIANVAGLSAGLYSGSVRVTSSTTGESKTVAVTLLVSQVAQTILLSQSGMTFTGVEGGNIVPSQSFGIVNTGQGAMSWAAQFTTSSGGAWLSVSPTSGSSTANSLQIPRVDVQVNVSGLRAGQYQGLVRVSATGANNSPQFVTVVLNVLPPGSNPGALVRPTGLIFAVQAGTASPAAQSVSLATAATGGLQAVAGVQTFAGGNWLDAVPRNVGFTAAAPGSISVQPTLGPLSPGEYFGGLTLLFADRSSQVVNVLFVVTSGTGPASARATGPPWRAAACVPSRLLATDRSLGGGAFSVPVGWPSTIEVQVKDDCDNFISKASVVASFSSGDPALALVHVGNGVFHNSWVPANQAAQVTVRVAAVVPDSPSLGTVVVEKQGQVAGNPNLSPTAPVLPPGGIVNAASFAPRAALAPGSIVSVFGSHLAASTDGASALPLPRTLGGATLNVGGVDAPLFYSSDGQVNAQLPFELTPNSRPHALVKTRQPTGTDAITTPQNITVAAAQPGIFAVNQQGTGQGAILNGQGRVVDNTAPAGAGEVVQVFCTGLGATQPAVKSGDAAPSSEPLARVTTTVTATVGGQPATVQFAGLAPGFVGLYQVNVQIPAGLTPGPAVPLVVLANGVPSNTVTLAIR